MCGCSSPVAGSVTSIQTLNTKVKESVPCDVSREEILGIKESLLSIKNPGNASFVNSRLGFIDTMLNYNNYCLYKIDTLSI